MFASETGEPLDRCYLPARWFKPLLKRAKLPETTRFHDLRHTCAKLLLTKSVNPKVVSEMLGHSNIAITLDICSHLLPNMQDSATAPSKKPSADALQFGPSRRPRRDHRGFSFVSCVFATFAGIA